MCLMWRPVGFELLVFLPGLCSYGRGYHLKFIRNWFFINFYGWGPLFISQNLHEVYMCSSCLANACRKPEFSVDKECLLHPFKGNRNRCVEGTWKNFFEILPRNWRKSWVEYSPCGYCWYRLLSYMVHEDTSDIFLPCCHSFAINSKQIFQAPLNWWPNNYLIKQTFPDWLSGRKPVETTSPSFLSLSLHWKMQTELSNVNDSLSISTSSKCTYYMLICQEVLGKQMLRDFFFCLIMVMMIKYQYC